MVFYLYGTLKIITTLKRLFCLFNIFINLLQAVSISFNWKPAGGVCNEPYSSQSSFGFDDPLWPTPPSSRLSTSPSD